MTIQREKYWIKFHKIENLKNFRQTEIVTNHNVDNLKCELTENVKNWQTEAIVQTQRKKLRIWKKISFNYPPPSQVQMTHHTKLNVVRLFMSYSTWGICKLSIIFFSKTRLIFWCCSKIPTLENIFKSLISKTTSYSIVWHSWKCKHLQIVHLFVSKFAFFMHEITGNNGEEIKLNFSIRNIKNEIVSFWQT